MCLVRDPRAVVASYKDWHGAAARRGVTESSELEADRERSRRSYNAVLMSLLWRGVVRASFAALEHHGQERVRIQRFERLARRRRGGPRALRLARARLRARPARDPGRQQLVRDDRRRVSSEPVERWRERLSATEVGIVQSVTGELMDELGYARDDVAVSPLRLGWAWAATPVAVARAGVLNRRRLGKVSEYVRTRAGAAFSRGPL